MTARRGFALENLEAHVGLGFEGQKNMIEIAGGIVLAMLLLALLPAVLIGAYWLVVVGLALVLCMGAGWMLWAGTQSMEGLAAELIVAGVFFIWLHYEIKARREIAAEQPARDIHSKIE
jgi:hypothetical protein